MYVQKDILISFLKFSKLNFSNNNKCCSEQFALFSVVQFPNEECTSSSSSTTNGTCYTTSEVQCVIRIFFLIIVYLLLLLVLLFFGFSVIAEEVLLQAPVLQVSECAASYQPPPAGPALTPTPRTSGTRATPAATLPLTLERVPSLSEKSRMTSVN